MLGDDSYVLEGMENDFLPVSFIIKLYNPEEGEDIIKELQEVRGVEKVTYPQKTVNFISKFTGLVRIVSSFLIIVLLIISVFIISNTTKLTVFARQKEINIMKYIGATDGFIRWPFIVEGVIIGLLGAAIAFLISAYGYNAFELKFVSELGKTGVNIISLVNLKDLSKDILLLYIAIGCIVGAGGSAISVRKYLKV